MLVAIHLAGGNDGLNTVVPWRDPRYRQARPSLALGEADLWQPGGPLAFNAALSPLRALWDRGLLSVVNGVGYPEPVRSHFRSAEIWQSGGPGARTGWLARTLEHTRGRGISVDTPISRALQSPAISPWAVGPADSFHYDDIDPVTHAALDDLYRQADPHLRETWTGLQTALHVSATADPHMPPTEPGKALATLLAFMPAAQIYHVGLHGFDTHANQRNRQHKALEEAATAVAAAWKAVEDRGLADRTTFMLYSEFGRRVEENASGGTDHGTAGPLFIISQGLRRGWQGEYPSLGNLTDGDLRYTIDFRQVYASVLEQWLGQRAEPVLGETFPILPLWA
jgi:uncharacterized protein (DUF1501 family)